MASSVLVSAFVLTLFVSCAVSQEVDLRGIAEPCASNFATQDYQENWEDKQDSSAWNIPMASRYFAYWAAHNLYKTSSFKSFTEAAYQKSCFLTQRINGWGLTNITGYNQPAVTMRFIPTTLPKVYQVVLSHGPLASSTATATLVLSDNAAFNVYEFCHDNGLRSFAVFSSFNSLIPEDKKAIQLHLKSIGFKDRHFIDFDTENNCITSFDNKERQPATTDDLPEPGPVNNVVLLPGGLVQYPQLQYLWKKK